MQVHPEDKFSIRLAVFQPGGMTSKPLTFWTRSPLCFPPALKSSEIQRSCLDSLDLTSKVIKNKRENPALAKTFHSARMPWFFTKFLRP